MSTDECGARIPVGMAGIGFVSKPINITRLRPRGARPVIDKMRQRESAGQLLFCSQAQSSSAGDPPHVFVLLPTISRDILVWHLRLRTIRRGRALLDLGPHLLAIWKCTTRLVDMGRKAPLIGFSAWTGIRMPGS